MSRFQFRLTTLLKIREAERGQRQIELSQALEALTLLQNQIHDVDSLVAASRSDLRTAVEPGEIQVDRMLEIQRHQAVLQIQRRQLREQQHQVSDEVERRRQVLVSADREVKTLEKLRDKQLDEHREQVLLREHKQMDEIADLRSLARRSD